MSDEYMNNIMEYLDSRDPGNIEYNCNIDMFCEVMNWIKKCNQLPDNLDYCVFENKPLYGTTTLLKICNSLNYGDSEGIYLDLWIEQYLPATDLDQGNMAGDPFRINLGTIKTLDSSIESLEKMGKLLADFIYHGYKYINDHYDSFDKTGYAVKAFRKDKDGFLFQQGSTFLADTYHGACKRVKELYDYLKRFYPNEEIECIKIIDKKTGHENVYSFDVLGKTEPQLLEQERTRTDAIATSNVNSFDCVESSIPVKFHSRGR